MRRHLLSFLIAAAMVVGGSAGAVAAVGSFDPYGLLHKAEVAGGGAPTTAPVEQPADGPTATPAPAPSPDPTGGPAPARRRPPTRSRPVDRAEFAQRAHLAGGRPPPVTSTREDERRRTRDRGAVRPRHARRRHGRGADAAA